MNGRLPAGVSAKDLVLAIIGRMGVSGGTGHVLEYRGDRSIEVNRYVIRKGLDRQLVLYWYQAHGRVVASEYWSKFFLIRDAVRLNRTDGALVRVIAPIPGPTAGSPADHEGGC